MDMTLDHLFHHLWVKLHDTTRDRLERAAIGNSKREAAKRKLEPHQPPHRQFLSRRGWAPQYSTDPLGFGFPAPKRFHSLPSGPQPPQVAPPQRLCKFHLQGGCKKGTSCNMIHASMPNAG